MSISPEYNLRFDYAIFADTQDEPQAVYQHLEWLKQQGGAPIIVETNGRLSDNIIKCGGLTKQRFISIPVWIKNDRPTPLRRQCTKEFKINVIDRAVRNILSIRPNKQIPANYKIHYYFGISLDEIHRKRRIEDRLSQTHYAVSHFPLIDLEITRGGCISWLQAYGIPHDPPRSACVYCPYKSNQEWQFLKDNDKPGWDLAVRVDNNIRSLPKIDSPAFFT